jgi:hypothetical protein
MIKSFLSNNKIAWIVIIVILLLVVSCGRRSGTGSGKHLFTLMPASVTHADFVNELDINKQLKDNFNIYKFRNFYNGGGVALGDINNDGLLDIFMTSNMGRNVLYLNKGNFQFEDISAKAGIEDKGQWSTGVSFADVNGDGLLDIYVCNSGNFKGEKNRNRLYINNGDLTFTERAEEYGIAGTGNSTQGVFFDYDKDGDLDLFLLNNYAKAIGSFNLENNLRNVRDSLGGDKLFRNDGGRFTDVSAQAGIYGSVIAFGMGVTVGDINRDGWLDIYVSNDFFERDYVYLNNHDGTFRENLVNMMKSISTSSMGGDMADINNDLYPEMFTTDMVPEHDDRIKTKTTFDSWESYKSNVDNGYYNQFTRNMLHLNNGDGTFSEIGRLAGVNATDWSWGALITDLDNDGLKDIFVANGIFRDLTDQDYLQYFSSRDMIMSVISGNKVDFKTLIDAIPSVKIPNYAYKNSGNYRFENKAAEWGLDKPSFSNGSAYGDLDNDGAMDLVVNNVNMPMFIYRNESRTQLPDNHFLKVILKGDKGNTQAIGSKITAKHNGKYFTLEQMPIRGYLSSVDPRPNLGLGPLTMVDSLIIEWPDDRMTLLTNVKTDQILTLYQKDAVKAAFSLEDSTRSENKYFKDLTNLDLINFTHREDNFNDFERELLMYQMMSTEGPRMCKGDVNGDGLEDIYICGAKGQTGALMIQQKDGTFVSSEKEVFEADRISEDTDCAMFDADGDGDLDLYVASGSNEFPESSSALSDRLYINDGKGHFKKSDQILPAGKFESTACVRPADFDKDGVTELFVGIRFKPFLYGAPVNGYILENDGKGNFKNVTAQVAPELLKVGMIRDMQWADVDNDGDLDIILVGDWMPVKIFINENGHFKEKKDAFGGEKTEGWWNCIATGDFNGDGYIDFIAGNLGLNSRLRASAEKPVDLYVNDFDLNGSAEQVLCAYDGDKSYPVALKHDITKQIPALEKKYPKYDMYKNQQITDIFSPEQLKNAIHLKAYLFETSLFINDGKGNFTRKPLPSEIQFSPVYAATAGDYNNDGRTDILLGGNLYNVKPELGRYDASYGSFLMGNGKGGFRNIPAKISGFRPDGEVRDIKEVKTSKGTLVVTARSNDRLQLFKILDR